MTPEDKLLLAIFDDGKEHEITTYVEVDGRLINIPIHYKAVIKGLRCQKEILKRRTAKFAEIGAPKELIDITESDIKNIDRAMGIIMVDALKYRLEEEKKQA